MLMLGYLKMFFIAYTIVDYSFINGSIVTLLIYLKALP